MAAEGLIPQVPQAPGAGATPGTPREDSTRYHIETPAKCLYGFSAIPQHGLLGWVFHFGSAQNWGFCFKPCFQPSSPILCLLQDQKHFQACTAAAAGCPSTFPTSTVSLIKKIAKDTKPLLISLLLKPSGCFSRCHTLQILSGMQEAASGPGAEPWAQRHPERSTINMQCFPSKA